MGSGRSALGQMTHTVHVGLGEETVHLESVELRAFYLASKHEENSDEENSS